MFVAASVRSLRQSLEKGSAPFPNGALNLVPARCITKDGPWGYTTISHKSGIQWHETPTIKDKKFYAIRQLGYGETGCCCAAVTDYSAPCALKFYHPQSTLNELVRFAQEEADKWKLLYVHLFPFVHSFQSQERLVLVMPLLTIAGSVQIRHLLCQNDKNSLLYKALKELEQKNYIHTDLKWHHVGLYTPYTMTEQTGCWPRSEQCFIPGQRMVVFCDLASVQKSDVKGWVDKEFDRMRNRIEGEMAI